jgi:hypothetical protein
MNKPSRVRRSIVVTLVSAFAVVGIGLPASGTTWTRDATNTYKNAFGNTIIRHTAIIQWSGSGSGTLYSTPKALNNDTYAITGINKRSSSAAWDWYTAGAGKTGQSNNVATFLLGIPTPWGNIGQTTTSRIINQVNGYGGMGRIL